MDKNGNKTGGRSKGTGNRVTAETREHFASFLHYASPKIIELWDTLYTENPKEALSVIKDYAEFVLPKLARVEQRDVDKDGNDKETKIIIEHKVVHAPNRDQ